MKKSELIKFIRESLKTIISEQNTTIRQEIVFQMQNIPGFQGMSLQDVQNSCCPKCSTAQNDPNDSCYSFCNHDCCPDPTGDDPCNDPLWISMPMGTVSNGMKLNYCDRCAASSADGNPVNGNFLVTLAAAIPYWVQDQNGINYCPCCEPTGCETTLPANHPSCVKCFSNQAAGAPIPPGGAANGAPGSGDNCECCEGGHSTDPCQGDNPHPECYWCPGHTQITNLNQPPNQCQVVAGNLGYAIANNITLYSDINDCTTAEADCINTTLNPRVKCQCCKNGSPISMAQEVPANPGCSVLNDPALGLSNCQLHPISGGPTKINCKSTSPGPVDVGPVDPFVASQLPRMREPGKVKRGQIGELKKLIKNILKEQIKNEKNNM